MTLHTFRDFCLSLPGVTESFPFGGDALVFKVSGKIFTICDADHFVSINLKWTPEENINRREEYPDAVLPGFHMNKTHWSTVRMDGGIPDRILLEWTRESYDIIVASLPKSNRPA